jgi:hypothetical protein
MIADKLRELASQIEDGAAHVYAIEGGVKAHPVGEGDEVYVQRDASGLVAVCLLVADSDAAMPSEAPEAVIEGVRACLGEGALVPRTLGKSDGDPLD